MSSIKIYNQYDHFLQEVRNINSSYYLKIKFFLNHISCFQGMQSLTHGQEILQTHYSECISQK